MDDSDRIRAAHMTQGFLHRMEESRAVSVCVLVKRLANQVRKDFCVRLGAEDVASADEFFAEMLVVFHNAVVDESQLPGGIQMGMRIFRGHPAMRSPPCVADAGISSHGIARYFFHKLCDASDRLAGLNFISTQHGNAG
jgi:hypothetical protein